MSDFNRRGKLPFQIVSSSVNTGYNAELTAAVGSNLEIVNQHQDEYGGLQDAPMQGPFTEQWVGGNQHRHIDINNGTDDASKRPEAFLVSGSTGKVRVYGPDYFDPKAPKALLTRGTVSKSPLNIKNIKNENRRLGNFSHNYQVVQTSGRELNQSLVQNNLTASGVLTTKFIEGVEDYSLPEITGNINKTVFVERFSAPGDRKESSRGALDRESEQYSPNNSLVTRNIKVRQPFYSQLTQHQQKSFINFETVLETVDLNQNLNLQNLNLFQSLSLLSFERTPLGMFIRNDGRKLYTVGRGFTGFTGDETIKEFDLQIPWDIKTAVFIDQFVTFTQETFPTGIFFKPDGTKVYIVGQSSTNIVEYNLSTPWSIGAGSITFSAVFSVALQDTLPQDICFNPDGTRVFIIGSSNNRIYQYSLSNPWSISSGVVFEKSTILNAPLANTVRGGQISFDGQALFVVNNNGVLNNTILKYTLGTKWDIDSIVLDSSIDIESFETNPEGLFINPFGNTLCTIGGTVASAKINQFLFYSLTPSIHKVNKNSIQKVQEYYNDYFTSSNNDNFWVQHAIPATDLRYKWIADSIIDSGGVIQYQKPFDSSELVFNTASLVVSGTNKQFSVDNIGIRSLIKDKKDVDLSTNTITYSSPGLSASFSEIANSAYQYPVWKQIRTGEHPVSRKLRTNNIVSIEGSKSKVINNVQTQSKRSDSVVGYIDPPVTIKHKPLKQVLELKGSTEKYVFKFSHTNNLGTFANQELLAALNIKEGSQQTYDLLKKYYSDPNRLNNPDNPVIKLHSYAFSETLYPKEVNTYLAETRARTAYILTQSGFTRDGYDRQIGTQRAFWRDKLEDRKRSTTGFYNSMNYLIQPFPSISGTEVPIDIVNPAVIQFPAVPSGYSSSFDSTGNIIYNSINNFDYFGGENYYTSGTIRLYSRNRYNISNTFEEREIIIKNKITDNSCSGELNTEIFIDNFYSCSIPLSQSSVDGDFDDTSSGTTRQLTRTTQYSNLAQYNPELELLAKGYKTYSSYSSSLVKPRVNYLAFLGGFESGSRNFSNELQNIYDSQPSGTILSTLDSGLRYATESFGDKKPWFDSYEEYSDDIRNIGKEYSILPEFRISSHMPYYVKDSGGNFRAINKAFLENDGSGISYRTAIAANSSSDQGYIKSYVLGEEISNAYELQQENATVAKLDKITFTLSGIKKLLPYNGFYPKDRTIQLANLFNDFLDVNTGGGYYSYSRTNASTNAVDYLIYNVDNDDNLYSKNVIMPYFFAPGILYNTIKSGISVDFPQITASGDYVVKTGGSDQLPALEMIDEIVLNVSMLAKNTQLINSSEFYRKDERHFYASYLRNNSINNRIPFESIIFPHLSIPGLNFITSSFADGTTVKPDQLEFKDFYENFIKGSLLTIKFDSYRTPEHFTQISYDGDNNVLNSTSAINFGPLNKRANIFAFLKNNKIIDPSYSLAMSNFLAEIPTFFLRDSSMISFKSNEMKDWKFEIGKKYYFDLKMKKSSDLVMIESYQSQNHITGSNSIEKTMNGRYFGWPVSKVATTGASLIEQNILFETTFRENEIVNNQNNLILEYNTTAPQNNIIFNPTTNTILIRTAATALNLQQLVLFVNDPDNWNDPQLITAKALINTNPVISGFTNKAFSGAIGRTVDDDYVVHNDPAYAPFTPPYFEGEAILRFELSASRTSYSDSSFADFIKDITLSDFFPAISGAIGTGSEAYRNKMSIQDCVEVFGLGINPLSDNTPDGKAIGIRGTTDTANQFWVISPKLETPVLDFSEQQFVQRTGSYWVADGYGRGMWSGYGKIPTGSQGITLELAESFPLKTDFRLNRTNTSATGSLLKQVGFKAESKKIGQLAEKKTISEAIVAIPFVDRPIEGVTTFVDGYHFFSINPFVFESQKTQLELNTLPKETSISRMIRLMKQYVIPPNFDFLTYYKNPLDPLARTIRDNREGIDPFVMYMFEFTHDLDQQDLADIWQGVMPKIAITAEKEQITFSHDVGENELFGENFKLPPNMRWMIFKVKKKAEWNYFAVTEDSKDDVRFKFNFANSQEAQTPDYSYNWPYDYFSLVELAKVDVTYEYGEKPVATGSIDNTIIGTDIDTNRFAIGNNPDILDQGKVTSTTAKVPKRQLASGFINKQNKTRGKRTRL